MSVKTRRKEIKRMQNSSSTINQKARTYWDKIKHPAQFSKPQLAVFIVVFGLIGYLILHTFAASPLVASMEAEQMTLPSGASVISDSSASAGKAIQMTTNGVANGTVNFPSPVTSLTVMARGDQCSGSPTMTVALDGTNLIANTAVSSSSWAAYSVSPTNAVGSGSHVLNISFTNPYSQTKKHGHQTTSCSRKLYVDVSDFFGPVAPPTPSPTITLAASPASLTAGGASTLTWSSTNANSCTASGAWAGSEPISGSVSTGALNQTSTYTLTCTGDGGSANASVTISVSGGVTWTFCSKEYQTCTFSGTMNVRFGINGAYITKTFTNSVFCDVSVFGDPAVGLDKECDTSPVSGAAGGTGSIPSHIETWAYDGAGGGGNNQAVTTSGALIRQWVTYAEGDPTNSKASTDCHGGTPACKAFMYLDTNLIYTTACGSVPIAANASENWWLHQPGYSDSAHRLVFSGSCSTANHLNPSVPAVGTWFKNYLNANDNSYDGLFMDDVAPSLNLTVYGSGFSSSQELNSDASVQAAHEQLAAALTHSNGSPFVQVNNGINAQTYVDSLSAFQQTAGTPNAIGLISEDSSVNHNAMLPQLYYGTLVDIMGYVDHTNYFLALLGEASNGDPHWRRVQEGTVLLGYQPGKIVDWANLETGSPSLAVWPEEGIYPTQPVQSMNQPTGSGCLNGSGSLCTSGGHNDVQVAPGVYRREFGNCYNQSVSFGRCAVIVNSTTSAVSIQASWLTQSYSHQIAMNGGDVQNGGTITTSGASSTSVPAQDALLLAQ